MKRTAVLLGEKDERLGACEVTESTRLISVPSRGLFIRTDQKIRLAGGGLGAVFEAIDPTIRQKLTPV